MDTIECYFEVDEVDFNSLESVEVHGISGLKPDWLTLNLLSMTHMNRLRMNEENTFPATFIIVMYGTKTQTATKT